MDNNILPGDNPEPVRKINRYFNYVMIVIYAGAGLSLIFTSVLIHVIPTYRTALGGVLIAYAAFRIYLILSAKKKEDA